MTSPTVQSAAPAGAVGHVAGVVELAGESLGERKGLAQRHQLRIAMDQDVVEIGLDEVQHFIVAAGLVLTDQNIAHRTHNDRAPGTCHRLVEQGDQLESHLPPAEREQLEDQHVRTDAAPRRGQQCPPGRPPRLVDRLLVVIDQLLEIQVGGADRRQLHEVGFVDVETGDRMAAGDQRHVQARAEQPTRQGGRPLEMTDAEQVLDVEQYPAARHGRAI